MRQSSFFSFDMMHCAFTAMGPSINYVVSVGRGGKDDLLNRPYLIIKTTTRGGGGQKNQILRQHSLWTAPKMAGRLNSSKFFMDSRQQKERA